MMFTDLSTSLRHVVVRLGAVMAAVCVLGLPASAGEPDFIKITMGKAEVVDVGHAVADIMVADPKIADVSALQSDKLYIVGSSLGDTNIIALDEAGNVLKKLEVHVRVDTKIIENMIREIFPNEKNVRVHMIGSQIALSGTVANPSVAQRMAKLVAAHMGEVRKDRATNPDEMIQNLLEVRGEQQVTLRVRILEVSRSTLKELGLETSANDLNETSASSLFNHKPQSALNGAMGSTTINTRTGLTEDPFAVTSLILDSTINGLGDIEFLINALERDNLANVLAEPNLTAVSGEKAGFLAGGEFPVPIGRDREGNIVIEYKQFGVSLNFKPIVLSEDRISLQLDTEVSSLDTGNGITLSDIEIPGLDVRRASTTVQINSGGSLMMAGLLKSENLRGLSGLPGVKDTPVLGDLVSSKSFERQETELVVLVTPYLVQPFADVTQAKPVFSREGFVLPPPPPTTAMSPADKGKPQALYTQKEAVVDVEKEQLSPVKIENSPMSKVFTTNMQKIYGNRLKNIPKDQAFGYMLD
ncbi:MAG: type II and III secretion system protein family protein [Pseudobdellovibrionaceae bacterium]